MRIVYFIIISLLLLPTTVLSQPLLAVKVWGEIKLNNGGLVEKGSEIQLSDMVSFSNNAKIILADKNGNLFWGNSPEGATFQLDKTLRPINIKAHRGFLSKNAGITDLKEYFGSSVFTIVDGRIEVPIDQRAFPLNNSHFIVFHYMLNGVQLSKKIGFSNQKLIIEKEPLLLIGNKLIDSNEIIDIDVYEYFPNAKQSNLITTFTLQFANKEFIEKELLTLVGYVKPSPEQKSQLIEAYLENAYGKFDGVQKMSINTTVN